MNTKSLMNAHEEELRKAEATHLSAIAAQQQHYDAIIEELSSEKEITTRLLEETQHQVTHLEQVLADAETAKIHLEQQNTVHSASLNATLEQLVDVQSRLQSAESEAEQARAQHQLSLDNARTEITTLQEALSAVESAKLRYEEQVSLRTASLDSTQEQFVALQDQLIRLEKEASKARAAQEESLDNALTEINCLEEALTEKERAVVELESQVAIAEAEASHKAQLVQSLEGRIKEVRFAKQRKGYFCVVLILQISKFISDAYSGRTKDDFSVGGRGPGRLLANTTVGTSRCAEHAQVGE